jgi:hypothetical protein
MAADEATLHDTWLAVARAAAEHRRIVGAGDEILYGDLASGDSADARAWSELTRAIRRAAAATVAEDEIVDALCSGDPRLDVTQAVQLVAWASNRDEWLRELNQEIRRDLRGEE